jgi:hypothetical protein
MLEIDLPRPGDHDGQSLPDLLLRAEGTVLRRHSSEGEFVAMMNYTIFDNAALACESTL